MAAGEKTTWSTKGREVKKFDRTPIPAGDWDAKFLGAQTEVATSDTPGSMPYVKVRFQALGSGKDGSPDKIFFHSFFLSLRPINDKGDVQPDNEDQILGFARALGEDYTPKTKSGKFIRTINRGKPNETTEEYETSYIDATHLAEWLKQFDGQVVKLHSRIQKGTASYPDPKAVIDRFYPADEGGAVEAGEESLDDMDAEASAEEVEVEEEVEETPKKPAPAAKGKAAPAKRR